MQTHVLETNYHGAILRLEFEGIPDARLRINGIVRQARKAEAGKPTVIRLASTVQTDYEWHEFVEGIVDYSDDNIVARLIANNTEIACDNFKR